MLAGRCCPRGGFRDDDTLNVSALSGYPGATVCRAYVAFVKEKLVKGEGKQSEEVSLLLSLALAILQVTAGNEI